MQPYQSTPSVPTAEPELSLMPLEDEVYSVETVNHIQADKPLFSWSDLYASH